MRVKDKVNKCEGLKIDVMVEDKSSACEDLSNDEIMILFFRDKGN